MVNGLLGAHGAKQRGNGQVRQGRGPARRGPGNATTRWPRRSRKSTWSKGAFC